MPERKKRIYDFSLPAYSSSGKENFAHKLTVRFDFKDYQRGVRDLRRSVEQLNKSSRDLSKRLKKTDAGYGVYISSGSVSDRSGFGNELISFELPGAEELSSELGPVLSEVGQMAKNLMQRKYATRRETGLMNSEIRYEQRRPGSNYAQVEIGWLRRWHKYFGYQEEGTRSITPMRSVLRTSMELQSRESEITSIYSKYFRKMYLEKGKNR